MSFSRQIRRSIKNHKEMNLSESKVFYPQGFKVYTIFFSILATLLIISGIFLLIVACSDEKNHALDEYLLLGIFTLMAYMESIYIYLLIWKLWTKRISLTIVDGKVLLKGVVRIKRIRIYDIEIITRANSKWDAVLIKAKRNRNKESNSKIVIPVIWFGKENLRKFIQIFNTQELNKKIKIDYLPT